MVSIRGERTLLSHPLTGIVMNQSNRRVIREAIGAAGKSLIGRLPETDRHPDGRNPYAHVSRVIKTLTGKSYIELPDDQLPMVLDIIDRCEKYPF